MNNFSPLSRVWIYQSNREFSSEEFISIKKKLKEFCANWISHGNPINSFFDIYYNRFIVIMVDETDDHTCGSAVDASLNFIKELEKEFRISLLDRMNFAYKENEKAFSVDKNTFEKLVAKGKINDSTIVFNNLVQTKEEFENNWEISFGKSWHGTILNFKF